MILRELLLRIRATFDDSGVEKAERGVGSLTRKINDLNRRALAGLKVAAKATSVATGFLGAALIKAGSDAEESESKFEAVFKDQADEARKWSESLAKSMGRSGFELRSFAAGLQDTFVPLGFARDVSSQMSRNLVELASDVASFQNRTEPEVMAAFTSALVGNHEAVRSFGIIITEARLKEKIAAMSAQMPEFRRESEAAQKVLARQQLIFEGTSDAQGDATATAGGFANQARALKAEVSAAARTVGMELLPVAKEAITVFRNWLSENKEIINLRLKQYFLGVAEVVRRLARLGGWVVDNWESVRLVLAAIASTYIAASIAGLITQFGTMISSLAQMAGLLARFAAVGAALGAGWVIGKKLDQWLGASAKLAKLLGWIDEKLTGRKASSDARVADRGRQIREERVAELRAQLNRFRQSGVQSVRGIQLNDSGIQQLVNMQRKKFGLQPTTSPAMPQNVRQMSASTNITVNVPPGTQAGQAQRVADAAGAATARAMRQTIGDVAR